MKKMVAWGFLNKTFPKSNWLCSGCNPLEKIFDVCISFSKILFIFLVTHLNRTSNLILVIYIYKKV
jgi:hypothetical protein